MSHNRYLLQILKIRTNYACPFEVTDSIYKVRLNSSKYTFYN